MLCKDLFKVNKIREVRNRVSSWILPHDDMYNIGKVHLRFCKKKNWSNDITVNISRDFRNFRDFQDFREFPRDFGGKTRGFFRGFRL